MRFLASAIMFVVMAVGVSGAGGREAEEVPDRPAGHRGSGQLLHRRRAEGHQLCDRAACRPRRTAHVPNQITIGQMYVQFQIPANKKGNMPPVIMVHGSTHTAACLESTPDGREGWSPYFVRQGISTYLVDQAGRGRSGFDESVIHEAAAMIRNGDVAGGTAKIPELRPDHRQWRLDGVVRPPHPGRFDHSERHADPARRSGRSEPHRDANHDTSRRRSRSTSVDSEHRLAHGRHRAGAPRDPTTTTRSSTTSSWCRTPR